MGDLTRVQTSATGSAAIKDDQKFVLIHLSTALVDIEQPDVAVMPDFYEGLFEEQINSREPVEGIDFRRPTEKQAREGALLNYREFMVMLDHVMNTQTSSQGVVVDGREVMKKIFLDEQLSINWDDPKLEEIEEAELSKLIAAADKGIKDFLKPHEEEYMRRWEAEVEAANCVLPGALDAIHDLQAQGVKVFILSDWLPGHEMLSDYFIDNANLLEANNRTHAPNGSIGSVSNMNLYKFTPTNYIPELEYAKPENCMVIANDAGFLSNALRCGHRVCTVNYNPSLRDKSHLSSLPSESLRELNSVEEMARLFDPESLPAPAPKQLEAGNNLSALRR